MFKKTKLPRGVFLKTFEETMDYYIDKSTQGNMDWKKLLTNDCPKCGNSFDNSTKQTKTVDDTLLVHVCGFSIKASKMTQIVANLTHKNTDGHFKKGATHERE